MSTRTFCVSPEGNNSWSGLSATPDAKGRDGPFATLERAREAVRDLKRRGGLPSGGIRVVIRGGEYRRTESFTLSSEDSGSAESPVAWCAAEGERTELTGGVCIPSFGPVTDPAVLGRLSPEARTHVRQADLRALGVTDYGSIDPRSGDRMELYVDGAFMEIARYPNEGWLTIADVPQDGTVVHEGDKPHKRDGHFVGRHCGRIRYDGDRPSRWQPRNDLWMHGYWVWDWADEMQRIDRIDAASREIWPAAPLHRYGFHKRQRFYFLNILEELDAPGEWYVDRMTHVLYFWPPAGVSAASQVALSTLRQDLVVLEGASHVELRGLGFRASRGGGVRVAGGTGNVVSGCQLSNLGGTAVRIEGGTANGVLGTDVWEIAGEGIRIEGGDRRTLTPAGNYAEDNHIHHFARRLKTYHPGITVHGVGNRVSHNLIHDAPHMAIGFAGNEHLIEYDEVHHVVTETNDSGACYNGRDPSQQGTVIRYNYWHHVGEIEGHGSNAVYFDDALCGNTVEGNVFYKAGLPGAALMGAVFIHGGRYNRIENNVFVECRQAYGESPWSDETWQHYSVVHGWHERLHVTVEIDAPPYTERYPWLANVMSDTRPNRLARNLVYRCGAFLGRGTQDLEANLVTEEDPGFADAARGDFSLLPQARVFREIPGFRPVPFHEMGLRRGRRAEGGTP